MEIRRIQVDDVHSFVDLWSRVYSEGAFLAKGPPPEDRVRSIIEKVVKEGIPNFIAVELSVFESNIAAIRLYKSLGFLTSGHGLAVTLPAGISTREQHMIFNIVENNASSR